jgi:hypothetical protein
MENLNSNHAVLSFHFLSSYRCKQAASSLRANSKHSGAKGQRAHKAFAALVL